MSVTYVSSAIACQDISPTTNDHGTQGTNLPSHVVHKLKKLDHLFNHKSRRTCPHCATTQVSWSCIICDRHLPNGKWADLGLPAEDEDESMFGRLRQVVQFGLVKDEDEHTFAYDRVQYVLKSWITGDVSTSPNLPVMEEWKLSLDSPGWKWANAKLSAEDSSVSIMGVLRSLSGLGLLEPRIALGWTQFGRSVAKCRAALDYVLDGAIAQTPLPAALANELDKYHESAAPEPMSRALADGLCKYFNLAMADFEAQPPAFSELGGMLIDQGCDIHQVSIASEKKKDSRLTVRPPPKKCLKEVAKAVEANNKYLEEERTRKEQAKEQSQRDRQAKRDEAAAKKARAHEDQRAARQRKAERRKQGKLQRAEKQAKNGGPWRSSQQSTANPVVGKEPLEHNGETTELGSIDELLAGAVTPSLENDVEAMAMEMALAPTTDEVGAVAILSSDSSTLIDESTSSSVGKTCSIDIADDCQCDECLDYDLAIDMLEGGSSDETPSQPEETVALLSPKPRSSRSESTVSILEHIASSTQASENRIPKDKAPEVAFAFQHNSIDELIEGESHVSKDAAPRNAFASQHSSIDELIEGTRPESTLNIDAAPFVPKVTPILSRPHQHTHRLPSANELPNWVELGLAAEAAEDSLFSRVWQLEALDALTINDQKNLGTIISKFWKQMYLATQDSPNILTTTSLPNESSSWNWSDFQLSAEDREDSIMDVTRKLASLGFWSICDEKALHDITLRVAKVWFVRSSEEDALSIVVTEPVLPKAVPERNVRTLQNTPSTASSRQSFAFAVAECNTTRPLPGLYRDGRMITSEADLSDYASNASRIPEQSSDEQTDDETEEVIVFKPRGRR